jgi:uncharacterized protein (TIGR02186 family)
MSRRCFTAAWLAGLLAFTVAPAMAQRLIISLSNHRVMVTSSYTGVDLVLFGSVERDRATVPPRGGYDVVVTVSGPRDNERTRRKGRVFGIWVNVDARNFVNVPSYLAVLSNKPTEAIADADTLRRLQVGFNNFQLPQRMGPDIADVVKEDPFRQAFVRLKKEHGLYVGREKAVTFLTPNLFRADVPMPPNVPFGIYEVDVKLFADGAMVAQSNSARATIACSTVWQRQCWRCSPAGSPAWYSEGTNPVGSAWP